MVLCGGSVKLNLKEGLEISSDGITKIIDSVVNAYDVIKTHQETEKYEALTNDYNELLKKYEECQQQLELTAPKMDVEIMIPTEETSTIK